MPSPRLTRRIGIVVALLVGAAAMYLWFREKSLELTTGVHRYEVQGDITRAFLVISNVGTAYLAVPLRIECQVDGTNVSTNYLAETPYTIFLRPGESTALTHPVYAIPLPRDTRVWKMKTRVREQTRRERWVNALNLWGIGDRRFLSRLLGSPKKTTEFQWKECSSGTLSFPSDLFLKQAHEGTNAVPSAPTSESHSRTSHSQ